MALDILVRSAAIWRTRGRTTKRREKMPTSGCFALPLNFHARATGMADIGAVAVNAVGIITSFYETIKLKAHVRWRVFGRFAQQSIV